MNSSTSHIGFDRFIRLDWVECVLKILAGTANLDNLNNLLGTADLGKEALAKTRTKLNSFGLRPRTDLKDLVNRGRVIVQECKSTDAVVAFAWGVAIASYPYYGKVAEIVGRLTSIQGDCSALEIHRRMSEIYGDREVIKRATQAVLQTQANWGVIERVEKGKRIIRLSPAVVENEELTAWLIEATVRYVGKPVPVANLQSLPVLFPFSMTRPLAYVLSNSSSLSLRSEGPSNQLVALRSTI